MQLSTERHEASEWTMAEGRSVYLAPNAQAAALTLYLSSGEGAVILFEASYTQQPVSQATKFAALGLWGWLGAWAWLAGERKRAADRRVEGR